MCFNDKMKIEWPRGNVQASLQRVTRRREALFLYPSCLVHSYFQGQLIRPT